MDFGQADPCAPSVQARSAVDSTGIYMGVYVLYVFIAVSNAARSNDKSRVRVEAGRCGGFRSRSRCSVPLHNETP